MESKNGGTRKRQDTILNSEILPEIRNKLTAPKVALERIARGEKVPGEFLELALKELKAAADLLRELHTSGRQGTHLGDR